MGQFKIGIYWKIFLTILACMIISSFVIAVMYLEHAPKTKIHPQIKKSLIQQTHQIADQINTRFQTSHVTLEKIIKDMHEKEQTNLRIFDKTGKEIAASMEERLKKTKLLSKEIIDNTLQTGWDIQLVYPWWVLSTIVSVPLKISGGETLILQGYYPLTKGRILPHGLPVIIIIIILGGLTVILSRYLTRPIRELTRATEKMAKGHFGTQVEIRSHDEVGQLAKTFNNMSRRLEEHRRSRRELFADISHEIRSPLARILTDAEILIDRQMEPKERTQHLKAICDEVKNLDQLIGDLSTLSRYEKNMVEVSFRRSSLKDLILQAISLFVLQIEEKGIILKQDIAENIPPVMIDPKRIGQVISNLLMNALRYTPRGSTIEVGLKQKDSMAEIWVRDSGPGIPEEKLPFIFERFYRVDKSRSRSTGGSGLGLAIAKRFVEVHGGEIHAESRLGEGTCIAFTLPVTS